MLLLVRALLTELAYDFFPKPRGFGKHLIQPVEYLFEIFCGDWARVRHFWRKDYGIPTRA